MLRLSTPGFSRFIQADSFNATYGGGEANVAVSLAQLGVPAAHVTRFPDNDLGRAATAQLRKYGVQTTHILYGGNRLGIYFVEFGAISRPSKVVYDRADSAFAGIEPGMVNWEEVLSGAEWFHWTGISPAISEGAARTLAEGIKVANRLGVKVSADVNYRRNLWQYGKTPREVMPELVEGCDLILCSKGDARDMFGLDVEKDGGSHWVAAAKEIMRVYPRIKRIVNTKRESVSASHNTLAGMMWNGQSHLTTRVHPIVPIVDRIGGGDAFVAGLLFGLGHYPTDQEALDFAVASSVLKHSVEGDANLVSVEEIETVMKGDSSGKLLR
jgi:2-dehydro-3-deoxygluconokinase